MTLYRICAILALSLLAGCASGANSHNMTASITPSLAAAPNSSYFQSMAISNVTGGSETNPLLGSQVSSTEFKQALKNSLHHSKLFSVGPQKYTVSAEIKGLDQPIMGFDMSVTSKVHYKVVRTSDNAVVFDKLVAAKHTATVGDSVLGVERLRLANEGSIKKNIMSFIAEVSKKSA